jgi:cystathionine beta-lyase/cystathionine gamma-synthase
MSFEFSTRAIHAGQPNEGTTGSVSFPIFQTSTYAQIEPGVHHGYSYSRTNNPTREALEANIASLESGAYGIAFSSGLAAVNGVLNLLKAGDHVIACRDLYGGSYRLFTKLYAKFGLTFSFVDTTNLVTIEQAITPKTRVLWLETPSNPLLSITDIAAASAIAKKHGVLTVVDNTFATPYLQQPLALGADIVLHSTTKYLNGHSDVIGGCVVTNDQALGAELKFYQNAVGAVPGPQDCYLTLRGTKTLAVRLDRHCENAYKVARFLAQHPAIEKTFYPGLWTHPNYQLAVKQMRGLGGGVVSFQLASSVAEAKRFTTLTKLFTLAESLGSVKSLLCHPATMTHASIEPDVRRAAGISDSLIRLSVGIEDAKDLIADLEQALAQVTISKDAPKKLAAAAEIPQELEVAR